MNFLITLTDDGVVISKIVNAPSWSSCIAYCEGTGLIINNITNLLINVVVNNPSSENCFNLSLIDNETGALSTYFVFDTDFDSLMTWINAQTEKTVVNLQTTKKTYVTV